ncbi:MAG: hypothetical protein JWM43_2960 [Acidobacteriaceae bacterium]|nr:hypothetical protein [Acidobacteriaceae bacterium]
MDAERLRAFLLTLPHVVETMQWGNNLVFWVGDKAIGGKMFALMNLDDPTEGRTHAVISYASSPARFPDLLELDGLYPAPYFARIHWIAVEHWQTFSTPDWENELRQAHAITLAKLPPRTCTILTMPRTAQRRLIHDRRQVLATQSKQPALSKQEGRPKKSKNSKPASKSPAKHQKDRGTSAGTPRSKRPPSK